MADTLGKEPETSTFPQYAAPFFVWGKCPHIRRVQAPGRDRPRRHVPPAIPAAAALFA